jgi:RHS repeat-associated protein
VWLLAKEAYGPANNALLVSSDGYREVWLGSVMKDQHDASGLLYRRNRYYDPATGRFTQEDPIGLAGGINLYGYANGDPVGYSDPFGLRPCSEIRRAIRTRINYLSTKVREYVQAHERGEADADHLSNIRREQGRLSAERAEYDSEGCNDDDDDDHRNFGGRLRSANHFINVGLPAPQLARNPRRHPPTAQSDAASWVNAGVETAISGENAGKVIVTAGGIYLLYRGVRMIPSAFPALWWTAPANLAAP